MDTAAVAEEGAGTVRAPAAQVGVGQQAGQLRGGDTSSDTVAVGLDRIIAMCMITCAAPTAEPDS